MQLYELMFILNPDLGDEDREKILARFQALIEKNQGQILDLQDLGLKVMAYKIEKKSRGRYYLAYLEGPGSMILEIERNLRIDENVMRFVTIKMDKHVTREDLIPKAPPEEEAEPEAEKGEVAEDHAE